MSLESSSSLVNGLRKDSPEAWRRLVRLYVPILGRWCRRRGLQDSDADDVIQKVLIDALRGISGFEPRGPGSFLKWLLTIANRRVQDLRRWQQRHPAEPVGSDVDGIAAEAESSDLTGDDLRGPLLRRALDLVRDEIEATTWQAFWLTVVEERATAQVAEQLGISVNAVRLAKSRVLRRLREELGDG